jgi:hypothetical protein
MAGGYGSSAVSQGQMERLWMSGRQATLLPPPVESEPDFEVLFFGVDPDAEPESDVDPASDFDPEPLLDPLPDPEPASDVVDPEPDEPSEELVESLDDPAVAPAVDFDERLSFL